MRLRFRRAHHISTNTLPSNMQTRFERQALYDEVWTTPVSRLAPKYGLSDNGLRKVCQAMNIPLPERGHWARIAAGWKIDPPGLPTEFEREAFYSDPAVHTHVPAAAAIESRPSFKDAKEEAWLRERLEFERAPANRITVNLEPSRWHVALIPVRRRLIDAERDRAHLLVEREKDLAQRAKQRNTGPNWNAFKYEHLDAGWLCSPHDANCMRVSFLTYRRALAIANALLYAAKARGFSAEVDDKNGRFVLSRRRGHEQVLFRLAERQEKATNPLAAPWEPKTASVPADCLAVALEDATSSRFEIKDSPEGAVQERLNLIFERIYRSIVRAQEVRRERADRDAQRAAAQAAAEELAQQRAAEAKAKAEEAVRREALIAEAGRWHQVEQLRAYIAHVAAQAGADARWLAWARQVAEDMDPTRSRLVGQ